MKQKIKGSLLLALVASLSMVGCHKKCVCTSYSGAEREYSVDEVDAQGGSCANMIMQADIRYYSYCEWR